MEKNLEYYQRQAAALTFESGALIGGRFVAARSGQRLASVNPATGAHLADVACGDAADVDAAVAAARRVFELGHWRNAPPKHRKKVLSRP